MKDRSNLFSPSRLALQCTCVLLSLGVVLAQNENRGPDSPDGPRPQPDRFGPGGGGPPGFGGPGGQRGFGGPGGPGGFGGVQQKTQLLKKFDTDGDGILNKAERQAAYDYLVKERAEGRGPRGFGGGRGGRSGPGGRGPGGDQTPAQPGPKMSVSEAKTFPNASMYDTSVVRTFFLEFEDTDWEAKMALFKNTDVRMPAKLTVDGKTYNDVGVHFRGMSSFGMVGEGRKRSLDIATDMVHKDQNVLGYRSFELLNHHEDPSFLRTVLSYQVEREYLPAPKANYVRVVINGENWGIYANAQPFNKDFIKDFYGTTKGARWKVPGSPGGRGSLAYLGDDVAAYKRIYELKTKDDPKTWQALINMTKILNETPADKLESALTPILDVEGALRFNALENVLINNDGYWVRTSDYVIYLDEKQVFHILPRDSNETFVKPGGPGFGGRGGPGGGRRPNQEGPGPGGPGGPGGAAGGGMQPGLNLDPLVAAQDSSKPLISKLLAVPKFRQRYLELEKEIATKWLDWSTLGPIAQKYHDLIASDVRIDTRKLDSTEDFEKSLTQDIPGKGFGPGGGGTIGLKNFADQRRTFLLNHAEIKKLETK